MTCPEPQKEHLNAMCLSASQFRGLRELTTDSNTHPQLSDEELDDLLQRNLIEQHGSYIYITRLGRAFVAAMEELIRKDGSS